MGQQRQVTVSTTLVKSNGRAMLRSQTVVEIQNDGALPQNESFTIQTSPAFVSVTAYE